MLNLSVTMPKREFQKVFSSGIIIVPPQDKASKMRRASSSLSGVTAMDTLLPGT